MTTYTLASEMCATVVTQVEADTIEEAIRIASWRILHVNHADRRHAVRTDWVVDSSLANFAGDIQEVAPDALLRP